ncbi:hypothetical protein PSEWESI4_00727 [Pseudomonas carbonaria]|uniref:Uncharacterized protein n=1 Tax=Zestomonas carbonaria TaxID=2762745 RepID=A0A7U7I7P1_9GAMM|nr:hypothetical protein PSEWESI4_00727 [Pseudomonas carbonaria]
MAANRAHGALLQVSIGAVFVEAARGREIAGVARSYRSASG